MVSVAIATHALCVSLPGGRTLTVPPVVPVLVVVVVLVALGYDETAALATILAAGTAARELQRTS